MNCAEVLKLLDAHVDGELDLLHDLEIERHVAGCPSCQRALANLTELRSVLSNPALHYSMPPGLEQRVSPLTVPTVAPLPGPAPQPAKTEKTKTEKTPPAFPRSTWRFPQLFAWPSFSMGAVCACAAFLLWNGLHSQTIVPTDDALASQVLSSHVRALMANHLMDVPSTDQHTVKPWFDGKLDFSPPVEDFASSGFPLIGGRLDYMDGRPVAALVYKRRRHIINLFVWPSPQTTSEPTQLPETRQGYHIVHWQQANSTYWAVSDLGRDELNQFVKLVQDKG